MLLFCDINFNGLAIYVTLNYKNPIKFPKAVIFSVKMAIEISWAYLTIVPKETG